MYSLKAMENEILTHLYELGILDLFGGWERISYLDENVVERLYHAQLVDKSDTGFIRLSALGVGTILFGFHNAEKIFDLL